MPRLSHSILFVVSHQFEVIGGHLLSAITLAKYLGRLGNRVGLLVSPLKLRVPELDEAGIAIHYSEYPSSVRPHITRTLDILRVAKDNKYDVIVAMDWPANFDAAPVAAAMRAPIVQVRAGGEVTGRLFLKLPGIVVFSQELLEGHSSFQHIPLTDMILSQGRVDFAYFADQSKRAHSSRLAELPRAAHRVLTISRLSDAKLQAIEELFAQLQRLDEHKELELIVVGDGDARAALETKAQRIVEMADGRIKIRFLGGFRVTPADLVQADIVVGQGRTVVEAIACGVPAAVCGNSGYYGLLQTGTLPDLIETNLTGRAIVWRGDLAKDLADLPQYKAQSFPRVREMMHTVYDASRGAEAILSAIAMFDTMFPTGRELAQQTVEAFAQAWYQTVSDLVARRVISIWRPEVLQSWDYTVRRGQARR